MTNMSSDLLFTIIGYIGSSFLTIMMIPQVYISYKTKKIKDISFLFVFFNIMATTCLIPYSLHFKLYPVLIANLSVGICNLLLVILKIHISYEKNKCSSSEKKINQIENEKKENNLVKSIEFINTQV